MLGTLSIDLETNFFTNSNRIKESNAFDVTAITAITGVCDHHVKKRPLFCTAARQSNSYHRDRTPTQKLTPRKIRQHRKAGILRESTEK